MGSILGMTSSVPLFLSLCGVSGVQWAVQWCNKGAEAMYSGGCQSNLVTAPLKQQHKTLYHTKKLANDYEVSLMYKCTMYKNNEIV